MDRRKLMGLGTATVAGTFFPESAVAESKIEGMSGKEVINKVAGIVVDVLHIDPSKIEILTHGGESYFILKTNVGEVLVEFTREVDMNNKNCILLKCISDYKITKKVIISSFDDIEHEVENFLGMEHIASIVDSGPADMEVTVVRLEKIQEGIRNILFDYFQNPAFDGLEFVPGLDIKADDAIAEMITKLDRVIGIVKDVTVRALANYCRDIAIAINEPDFRKDAFNKEKIDIIEFLLRDYWKEKTAERKRSAEERFDWFKRVIEEREDLSRWLRESIG